MVDAPHSKCGGFGHESSSLSLPIVTIGSNRSKPSVELFLRMDITLNPGDLAPELILPDAEGNLVRLSDFRGKRVVLYFYPRDNTPGCRKEACGFRDIYKDLAQSPRTSVVGCSATPFRGREGFNVVPKNFSH